MRILADGGKYRNVSLPLIEGKYLSNTKASVVALLPTVSQGFRACYVDNSKPALRANITVTVMMWRGKGQTKVEK